MKRIITYIALIIFSAVFFYSCNSGGSGEAYTINMRLNKADTFSQDLQMNMTMNTAGMDMNMKLNTVTSFEVIKGDSTDKEIKLTYKKMQQGIDMGQMGKMMPDSVKHANYDYILGKSVVLKLSKDNEITEVIGFDEIMNNAGRDSASKEMMKKMFSKEQFNNMFSMMFSMYPKKPVKVGESWSGETKINMANLDMKTTNTYKLISVKNGLAEISVDGTISGEGEVMKTSGIKMDMSGTQKGTMTIRMDNGYLHNSNYKMDVKAEMQMMGQKIPITMKADYIIKGI